MNVSRKIQGKEVLIRKPSVLEFWCDGVLFKSTNSYDVLQAEIFEFLLNQIEPNYLRTTDVVMKLYYDVQLLIDIAKQELSQ